MTSVAGPTASRCQATVSNSSANFGADGGAGTLTVSVARECAWTAASDVTWISITAGASGQGDGTVGYRVAANADPSVRRGGIAVADQRADIGQEAAACDYTLSAPAGALQAAGANTSVDLRTRPGCGWQARTDSSWLSVRPESGSGQAVLVVTAAPNAGTERTANVLVSGQRVTLRQLAAPPAPSPTPAPTPAPTPPPPPTPAPTPTPTPTPPPAPSPPPPGPQPISVDGKVNDLRGSCPSLTFTLKQYTVRATPATEYRKGPCKDVRNGKDVRVIGTLSSATTIDATSIEVK